MKSILSTLTLTLFFILTVSISAQEAIKYPLLEHFTNTRCPICANRNPGFHDLRQTYGDQVNHIAFHPKYPYSTCAFYQANKEGNQSRTEHYGITGTPVVYLDGTEGQGTNMVRGSAIDAALQETSFFDLNVSEEENEGIVNVTVIVTARGSVPVGSTYRIFVAAVEETVDYQAPNGENMHYNVFRVFSSAREGEPISPLNDMESDTFAYQYELDGSWDDSEMYSIAFLQNDQDGSIENSGRSIGIISSSEGADVQTVGVYPVPASDILHFTQEVDKLQIWDISGKVLIDRSYAAGLNHISLKDLNSGIYFLKYGHKGHTFTQKIIVE